VADEATSGESIKELFDGLGAKLPSGTTVETLKDAIHDAIFGQQANVDKVMKKLAGDLVREQRSAPIGFLPGSASTKLKAAEAIAARFEQEKKDRLEQQTVIIIEDINLKSKDQIADELDRAFGLPTRRERGVLAGEAARKGTSGEITGMKRFRFKTSANQPGL
jgi:hypothetical protein